MVPELIDKYVFLVQTFIEAGSAGLSLQELQDRWEGRYGEPYPRRTFVNHRAAVAEVFGVEIACDRSTNRYYIDSGESAVDRRAATEYLIDTFTVRSLLTLGQERLSGRVSVEEIPSGHKYLTSIMEAMLDNAVLSIEYRKYLSPETDLRTIRPYALKEFEKRWYVVAYSESAGDLRTFALDRIAGLRRTGDHFRMPAGFNVDTLFQQRGKCPSLLSQFHFVRNRFQCLLRLPSCNLCKMLFNPVDPAFKKGLKLPLRHSVGRPDNDPSVRFYLQGNGPAVTSDHLRLMVHPAIPSRRCQNPLRN